MIGCIKDKRLKYCIIYPQAKETEVKPVSFHSMNQNAEYYHLYRGE
jgi:hypothetical protein